jgi:hypothetical protein
MKATLSFILALLILSFPLCAYAHDEEAYIELNVKQAQPGMTIEVRGHSFEPGDSTTIALMLVGTDRPQLLGQAAADDQGDLVQTVLLPLDVIEGAYEVRVTDSHHVATALLDIVAVSNSAEGGGQRNEEEPLLAPMPTSAAISTPAYSATAPIAQPPLTEASPALPIPLLLGSGLALMALIGGGVALARRLH